MKFLLIWPAVSMVMALIMPASLEPKVALTVIGLWPIFIPKVLWRVLVELAGGIRYVWKCI